MLKVIDYHTRVAQPMTISHPFSRCLSYSISNDVALSALLPPARHSMSSTSMLGVGASVLSGDSERGWSKYAVAYERRKESELSASRTGAALPVTLPPLDEPED